MKITTVESIQEFKSRFHLSTDGRLLEEDLDVVKSDCDVNARKRRDAEVLCTLAANTQGSCLDLGTSHGRSAFKLGTNLMDRGTVFTVNLLPEQADNSSGQLITHLLPKEEIGSYYRARGLKNIIQIYANTAVWTMPSEIRDLGVVFVDAAHDAERVYEDTRKIYDRVRPGGFICWHDFSPDHRSRYEWIDSVMQGVERFMAEVCPQGEIIHLRNSWIGVLQKPTDTTAKLKLGLVLEKEFHEAGRWTNVTTPYLVNGILTRFDCCWIGTQSAYEKHLGDVDVLLSFEAGWGTPVLELTRTPVLKEILRSKPSYMFYSDPHHKPWREDYFLNGFAYLLAFYDAPTRYHFRQLPAERLVHFPWAIPDHWISHMPLRYNGDSRLTVFGASEHEAYELRNWCRRFSFVESCTNSGCENKFMPDADYLKWLSRKEAIIAAGSDDPKYRLTTPKYFEIAAVGALLFAQETGDLEKLGFRHRENCLVFTRANFEAMAQEYFKAPESFLEIRQRGRELIRQRHAMSVRLNFLEQHMRTDLEKKKSSQALKTCANIRRMNEIDQQGTAAVKAWVPGEPRPTGYPPLSPAPLGDELKPVVLQRKEGKAVIRLAGNRLHLHEDKYLDQELITGQLFDKTSVGLMARFVSPGTTVLDIGANFGFYTLLFSRWVGPVGRVIAFEPTREYGQRLQLHLAENNIPNVRFENCGLSDVDNSAVIHIGECSGTMHWTAPSEPRAHETIKLERLDVWWARYVAEGGADQLHCVKLDVDGHELQVLKGAREVLLRHKPILLIEFYQPNFAQAGYSCADLADYLESELGYVLHREIDGQPFANRAALLEVVDRPDRSANILCLPSLVVPSVCPSAGSACFTSSAELYLASADRMDLVLSNLAHLQARKTKADIYATVVGGLSGLNYLIPLKPKKIVFFDLNPTALPYARLIIDLIKLSRDPQDFISRVFARSVASFLEKSGQRDLAVGNQEAYLQSPIEAALLKDTVDKLSAEARQVYQEFVLPLLSNKTVAGVRNCRRLLPCWPVNQRVPVGGGLAFGYDEAGKLAPNTNTFFYGMGWLGANTAFEAVKQALASAELKFVELNLLKSDLSELDLQVGKFVLHVSNIDDWFPAEWPQRVISWQKHALASQVHFTLISSHHGLSSMEADPHAYACAGLAPHVFGQVVEVTHKVPWGFHEFQRTNVSAPQYLQGEFPADTTILHILIGEGIPQTEFVKVYQRALLQSRRVIVLEHNRASADWGSNPPAHYVTETDLRDILGLMPENPAIQLQVCQSLAGEIDNRRNLLVVLDLPNNHSKSEVKTTIDQSERKATSPANGQKPCVLLIADVPNWIFARHCQVLRELLSDRFNFTIQFQGQPIAEEKFDLIYPLEWNLVPREQIRTPAKYVTGIRSHISWKDEDFLLFTERLNRSFQRVHVVSRRLLGMFEPFLADLSLVTHGVSSAFFTPRTRADLSGHGKLRIGWAGNRINATKGFEQYVAPLARLPGVELIFCGYQDKNLNMEQMREFYNAIDVYICSSSLHHEGNNNSLLEAAAMQRAIITTDNGTVPEYLRHNENAIIVDRELPNFIRAVIELRDNPAKRVALGEKARVAVQSHFEWRLMAEEYAKFFNAALARRDQWRPDTEATRRFIQVPPASESNTSTGNLDEIEAQAREALAINPKGVEALRLLACVLVQRQQWAEAGRVCFSALEVQPNDVSMMLLMARCFFETGDLETTEVVSRRVLELEPDNEVALENLAILQARRNGESPKSQVQPSNSALLPGIPAAEQHKYEQIACPFCRATQAEPFRQSADIVKCLKCSTIYLRTRFRTEILEKIYQSYADDGSHAAVPKSLEAAEASSMKRKYLLDEILQFTKPAGKILDVGCSWGAFLLNARHHGFEPTGLEITRKAVAYANETLKIPVTSQQFLDAPYEPNSLQVVTMNHVLEHLPQPREALKKVFRILKPGGMFCGIVPNVNSFCSRHEGEQWYWLDPNYHYVHYSPETLRRHFEEAGFVMERIYTACGDYGAQPVRKVAEKVLGPFQSDSSFQAWLRQIEADGQGEELRFFARKPETAPLADKPGAEINAPVTVVPATKEATLSGVLLQAVNAIEELRWDVAHACYHQAAALALDDDGLKTAVEQASAQVQDLISHNHPVAPVAGPAISFCIITNGKRPEKLRREIESIRALQIPQYEILVGGEVPEGFADVRIVPVPDAARHGRLGEMRNRLVEQARYDHLIVADDDLFFLPDFYANLVRYGDDYDVQCVRFLNPDGSRYWDWATNDGPRGHALLPYKETDPHVYVTGGLCIMKAAVAKRVKWDEGRGFYQGEDADFSRRLHEAGVSIKCNPACVVIHHDTRYTQFGLAIHTAESLRAVAIDHVLSGRTVEAKQTWHRLFLLQPQEPANFSEFERHAYIERQEGRYVFLRNGFFPPLPGDEGTPKEFAAWKKQVEERLASFGPFYAHFGGAGDALLLLATFLDEHPDATVLSYANSLKAAKSFFDAFPEIGRIIFLPAHESIRVHVLLRQLCARSPLSRGMGTNPEGDYFEGWDDQMDIFSKYGVNPAPAWPRKFKKDLGNRRVTVAPKGSVLGMVGSKRNLVLPQHWPELIRTLQYHNCTPVLLGTPDEVAEYPALPGCEEHRSYSFQAQMEQIASSELFVGADSWGKTFAALTGIPTLVFEAIKGSDWRGKKDASDFVFLDPWKSIRVVNGIEGFKEVFPEALAEVEVRAGRASAFQAPQLTPITVEYPDQKPTSLKVAWEGTFLDYGSLSHVNRQMLQQLSRQPRINLQGVGRNLLPPAQVESPVLQAMARRLQPAVPAKTEVTIRHAWPPDWTPPASGTWVLVQPWEYGSLPFEWLPHLDKVDEIWVPSTHVRSVYLASGVKPAKVKVVPNGIDPETWHPGVVPMSLPTQKNFKFLFVGGTIPRKGADLLLQTYLNTFTAADDVCLVIKDFGGQSFYAGQTLEQQIKAAQVKPDAPEILYLTEEMSPEAMPGLYAACQCLVHPYRGEGFGLPVLEAMACGLPVIVTAGGATDDFVSDQIAYRIPATRADLGSRLGKLRLTRRGWWLEPSPKGLAEKMRWVLTHREEARAKGCLASKYVREHWTWERAAQVAAQRLQNLAARRHAQAETVKARRARKMSPIRLPDAGRIGDLTEARKQFEKGDFQSAWQAAHQAMQRRPYHPEACVLLAQAAKDAGAFGVARRWAAHARDLAPDWRPARQLLKELSSQNGADHATLPCPPEAKTPPRLTVCLVVKNEEKFLPQCLASVHKLAHQIVVVDTGSTDRTIEIARQYGADVSHFTWCDDFSAARNAALEKATGDWILMLDADEELLPESHALIARELQAADVIAYRLPILDAGRESEGPSYVPRLFRNAPGLFYVGRVHEQVFSSVEVRRREWGLKNRLSEATIFHHGYAPEVVRERNKINRNLRLLEKAVEEMPNEPNLLMNLGLELMRSGQVEEALEQYWEAVHIMSAQPADQVVPELRETLLTQLATHLLGAKDNAAVISLLQMPLARRGGLTANLHFLMGLAYLQLEQYGPAAEQMRHCLARRDQPSLCPVHKDMRKAGPHHCLALCLRQLQQPEAAERAFQAALEADPQSVMARFDYARFLVNRQQPVEALKQLHQIVRVHPHELAVWYFGGQIALSQPEFIEFAVDWTGEAGKLFPDHPALLAQRAEALLLRGETAQALECWRKLPLENHRLLAGRVLCELLSGQNFPVPPPAEPAVSQEFLKWYRGLIRMNLPLLVRSVNDHLGQLRQCLPTAAGFLEQALLEVARDASA